MRRIERFKEKRKKIKSLSELSLLQSEKNTILVENNKKLSKLNPHLFDDKKENQMILNHKNIQDIPKFHQKTLNLMHKIKGNLKSEILEFNVKRKYNNKLNFSQKMEETKQNLNNHKINFEQEIKQAKLDFSNLITEAKKQEKQINEVLKTSQVLDNKLDFKEIIFRNESFGFKTNQITKTSTLTRDYKKTFSDKNNTYRAMNLLIILGSCLVILIVFVLFVGGF